jgi:hypothetical protein
MNLLPGPFLGGLRLLSLAWVSQTAIIVRFASVHAGYAHHLYAGKERIGRASVGDRGITAHLVESEWPQPLTLVAVPSSQFDQQLGDNLPPRAWNRPFLTFTASGGTWADAKTIEVLTGEFAGDPVDDDFERGRAVFDGVGDYEIQLPPLPGSGFWPVRVQGRDGTLPTGNVGAAAETVVRVVSSPPDLVLNGDGERFAVEVAGGVATIDCEVP